MIHEDLPEDVDREIVGWLDAPSLLTTRGLSKGWRERKEWCTPEWVGRQKERSVTKNELSSVLEDHRRMFALLVLNGYIMDRLAPHRKTVTAYFIDTNGESIIVSKEYHLNSPYTNILDRISRLTSRGVLSALSYGISSRRTQYYWVDPLVTRDIQRKRLTGCDVEDASLWDFFPVYSNDERFEEELRGWYAIGAKFCMSINRQPPVANGMNLRSLMSKQLDALVTDQNFV